jgi:glycosyltransferase involved in cell wall biosynthesis
MRLLARRMPGMKPFHYLIHPVQAWRRELQSWFRGPLGLDEFDAVHVTTQTAALAPAFVRAHRRFKLSMTIDATEHLCSRDLMMTPRPSPRRVEEERVIFSAADQVFSLSEWAAESVHADYGVPRFRILVTPPPFGLPHHEGKPRPSVAPTVDTALPRILFIGSNWRRKGGPRLLRWHQQRWANRAQLDIVSDHVASRPLRNVHFHGSVEHGRLMRDILPAADLLVLPTHRDMSSFVAVEAAATGVPVVASRLAGIPELIIDSRTGFLIPPDDDAGFIAAIERLLSEPALRRAMGRAARTFATQSLRAHEQLDRTIDTIVALANT